MKFIPIEKPNFSKSDKLLAKYVGYIILAWFLLSLGVEMKSGLFLITILVSVVVATYYFIDRFILLIKSENK